MQKIIVAVVFMFFSLPSNAIDYDYKSVGEFPTLSEFETAKEFEENYAPYVQDCLDNTFGGTGGIPCLIGYEMWDKELNIYYSKLLKLLDSEQKRALEKSQIAWIKERDSSIRFNSLILDRNYKLDGTAYLLMRAGDADQKNTMLVKQRVLLLRSWIEDLLAADQIGE